MKLSAIPLLFGPLLPISQAEGRLYKINQLSGHLVGVACTLHEGAVGPTGAIMLRSDHGCHISTYRWY